MVVAEEAYDGQLINRVSTGATMLVFDIHELNSGTGNPDFWPWKLEIHRETAFDQGLSDSRQITMSGRSELFKLEFRSDERAVLGLGQSLAHIITVPIFCLVCAVRTRRNDSRHYNALPVFFQHPELSRALDTMFSPNSVQAGVHPRNNLPNTVAYIVMHTPLTHIQPKLRVKA
ncbi:hypothetical protein C8J56DRAFT_1051565 [Mycena floridula]|nr:hypothetical protein C8J56DRAFT_1051565 [Mycena floridula]